MTAKIYNLNERRPPQPEGFTPLLDHPFSKMICEANKELVGSVEDGGLDNFVLFKDEKYPGKILADVCVKPLAYIQGLFYVQPEDLKLKELDLNNYRFFTEYN